MTGAISVLQYGVEFLAVGTTGYFAVAMWRRRSQPTARSLLAVAVLVCLGAVAHVAVVHPALLGNVLSDSAWARNGGPLWMGPATVVVTLAGGFWFLFALQYTGRGGRLVPVATAGIGVLWLVLLGLALFGNLSPPPEARARTNAETVLFLGSFVMAILTIVGAALVLTTSLERNAVRFREALALAGGATVLGFVPIVSDTLLVSTVVPAMLAVSSGLFTLSVRRYPTFAAPPVARIAGRDRLIEEIDTPFVVVDLNGRVRDLNPAGERYFETERSDALGNPLDALFPTAIDPDEVAGTDEPVHLRAPTGATLAVTANRITDARDRSFGHLLVCRDVTGRRRRESRLRMLSRLLTTTVSDRMRRVAAGAAPVADADGDPVDVDPSTVGSEVREETTDLLDLVARTREVERALAEGRGGTTEVAPVVREVVGSVAAEDDVDAAVSADEAVPPAAVDRPVLETTVEILLADALDSGRGAVDVAVSGTDRGPEIHVVDDRPVPGDAGGTDDPDTDRTTRSDASVELVRLAAEQVGGDVSTRVPGAAGRRVTVELPGVDGCPSLERTPPGSGPADETDPDREVERP